MPTPDHPWAILLAGGDGARLRSLTQRISGDARPKQFCPLLDSETLLDRTRRRADLVVRPDHRVVVVTRAHARYHAALEGRRVVGSRQPRAGPRIAAAPRSPAAMARDGAGLDRLTLRPGGHWRPEYTGFGCNRS